MKFRIIYTRMHDLLEDFAKAMCPIVHYWPCIVFLVGVLENNLVVPT